MGVIFMTIWAICKNSINVGVCSPPSQRGPINSLVYAVIFLYLVQISRLRLDPCPQHYRGQK